MRRVLAVALAGVTLASAACTAKGPSTPTEVTLVVRIPFLLPKPSLGDATYMDAGESLISTAHPTACALWHLGADLDRRAPAFTEVHLLLPVQQTTTIEQTIKTSYPKGSTFSVSGPSSLRAQPVNTVPALEIRSAPC